MLLRTTNPNILNRNLRIGDDRRVLAMIPAHIPSDVTQEYAPGHLQSRHLQANRITLSIPASRGQQAPPAAADRASAMRALAGRVRASARPAVQTG